MKFSQLDMFSHFKVFRPEEQDPDGHDTGNHEGKIYRKISEKTASVILDNNNYPDGIDSKEGIVIVFDDTLELTLYIRTQTRELLTFAGLPIDAKFIILSESKRIDYYQKISDTKALMFDGGFPIEIEIDAGTPISEVTDQEQRSRNITTFDRLRISDEFIVPGAVNQHRAITYKKTSPNAATPVNGDIEVGLAIEFVGGSLVEHSKEQPIENKGRISFSSDEPGPLQIEVNGNRDTVFINFNKSVKWIEMSRNQANDFAIAILQNNADANPTSSTTVFLKG